MTAANVALLRRSQRSLAVVVGSLTLVNAQRLPREFAAEGWPTALTGALVGLTLIGALLSAISPADRFSAWLLCPLPLLMRRELIGISNGAYAVCGVLALWLAMCTSLADSDPSPVTDGRRTRAAALVWTLANAQVHVIYGAAFLAKLRVPEWRNGQALSAYNSARSTRAVLVILAHTRRAP